MIKIIDLDEIRYWLYFKGLIDSKANLTLSDYQVVNYVIPVDDRTKASLATTVASFFKNDSEVLFWINEFGMGPTSEDLTLFSGFRNSLGESRELNEAPGHLFSKDDLPTIVSLLSMVLFFAWGAILAPISAKYLIEISHNGIITIYAMEKESLKQELSDLEKVIKA